MSDFYQTGEVTTLHALDNDGLERLEREPTPQALIECSKTDGQVRGGAGGRLGKGRRPARQDPPGGRLGGVP